MTVKLKSIPHETEAAVDNWQLLRRLILKADAMISVAIARLERANRLRAASPPVAIGKQAAVLSKATEYEAKAHAHLALLPEYHKAFSDELTKVRQQIERNIGQ